MTFCRLFFSMAISVLMSNAAVGSDDDNMSENYAPSYILVINDKGTPVDSVIHIDNPNQDKAKIYEWSHAPNGTLIVDSADLLCPSRGKLMADPTGDNFFNSGWETCSRQKQIVFGVRPKSIVSTLKGNLKVAIARNDTAVASQIFMELQAIESPHSSLLVSKLKDLFIRIDRGDLVTNDAYANVYCSARGMWIYDNEYSSPINLYRDIYFDLELARIDHLLESKKTEIAISTAGSLRQLDWTNDLDAPECDTHKLGNLDIWEPGLISGRVASNLAVFFAGVAFNTIDGVVFDDSQNRIVMKKHLQEKLLDFQYKKGLSETGKLDYSTMSTLSGKKTNELLYNKWTMGLE